jgi:uncharacterized membrane protein
MAVLVSLASYGVLIVSYHSLPSQIPVHYNLFGLPDVYTQKGFFSVFGVAVVHLILSVLILWMHSHPKFAHIPGKIRLEKLQKPYRQSVEWILRHMTIMMFVVVSLTFSYITLASVVIGLGFATKMNQLPLLALIFMLIVLLGVYSIMINRITWLAAKRKKLPSGW